MIKFREELLTEEKTVIHCDTLEKAKTLLEWADSKGHNWCNGTSYLFKSDWDSYKENTCYYLSHGEFGRKYYFKEEGYKIISYDEALMKKDTMEEFLVVGNVVELVDGNRYIILPDGTGDIMGYGDDGTQYSGTDANLREKVVTIHRKRTVCNYYGFFTDQGLFSDSFDLVWEKDVSTEKLAELTKTIEEAEKHIADAKKQIKELFDGQ